MSQRMVCTQFTPQLWRATKCKFCFNDKESHEKACKENSVNTNLPPSSTKSPSPKSVKRLGSTYNMKSDDNLLRSPTRRNTSSNSDEASAKAKSIFSKDAEHVKNRPSRIKLPSTDDKTLENVPVTSPIENISLRLEMNKQLLAKDDKIHNLEIRNQNLENEIRTLKDQNAQLAKTQQSEEEHKKMLDKIASLRKKLSDMEVKHTKIKEEKQDVDERLKKEEQSVSKLKIKINSMEHEQYLLELKFEREQKHKQSVTQEKEEVEQELEKLRKAYRNIQRESRRLSTTVDVDEDKSRELEDQLRQTQRRLGLVEVENNRLKDKMRQDENEKQDNEITSLQSQLSTAQTDYTDSQSELEDLKSSHLSEIQILQSQISRLQRENDELSEGETKRSLELTQIKRELTACDETKSEALCKDEELQLLRAEVVMLQGKCSALRDIEFIHVNLNKELDRHRERADAAEQHVRQLRREVVTERALKEGCIAELDILRIKEEECKQKHFGHSIRTRSSSLEPAMLFPHGTAPNLNILKKIREPPERDDSSHAPITSRFLKPAPPANRRRPSREHLQQRAKDSEV